MPKTLPKRLLKEPLIDAVFECRFTGKYPASNILPAFLFKEFGSEAKLERLFNSDIPEAVRNNEPNLMYAPLLRLVFEKYTFLVGDRSIAVACNLPYQGWASFKNQIINTIRILEKSDVANVVDRYSLKYVDFIPLESTKEQVDAVALNLKVGEHMLIDQDYQVRMEIKEGDFFTIVQLVSGAKFTKPSGEEKSGLVIDVDTIKNVDSLPVSDFEAGLDSVLEDIHTVSKQAFFNCLTQETLGSLEPKYD